MEPTTQGYLGCVDKITVRFGSIWIGSTLAWVRLNCVGFTRAPYHTGMVQFYQRLYLLYLGKFRCFGCHQRTMEHNFHSSHLEKQNDTRMLNRETATTGTVLVIFK